MARAVELKKITDRLVKALKPLRFSDPVSHVYNPLVYARAPYDCYIEKYARASCEVLLLGMNPGPFGMAQTGVPFGEIAHVRDWLKIDAPVSKPKNEHPKRPVEGFDCPRSEVSGRRLWGWAKETFGTPKNFFARFFIANYSPLVFMESGGKNRTPDKIVDAERTPLFDACDRALRDTVKALGPRLVVGVGKFAEGRARAALEGVDVEIGFILHPSPASPAANRGWAPQAMKQLKALGVKM